MAWRSVLSPGLCPMTVGRAALRTELPDTSCPPGISRQLAANSLRVDEGTVRDGNCGVHAFITGLIDQTGGMLAKDRPVRLKRLLSDTRVDQKIAMARAEGVKWLKAHTDDKMWEGMSVCKLCEMVSGTTFAKYIEDVECDCHWADTVFLHALGCAYGANVYVFQDGMDISLLGPTLSMCEGGEEDDKAIAVPVALANNYHYWGVKQEVMTPAAPVDKGDFALCLLPVSGQGVSPQPGRKRCRDEDDGVDPTASHEQETLPVDPCAVHKELELCQALAHWCPWSEPSAELLSAMQVVAGRGLHTERKDVGNACLARASAMQQLAYEEVHGSLLPEALKYQRAARYKLMNPSAWKRGIVSNQRLVTRSYLQACAGVPTLEQMASQLADSSCAAHGHPHGPGNPGCIGQQSFAPSVVVNWRVLWWSLPKTSRKEHLLKAFWASLANHRAMGGTDERWRMQFHFLGRPVCRQAFMFLTGVSCFACNEARQAALVGKHCWVSRAELGLASSICNSPSVPKYLNARQWLEWYAATYAEMSPMSAVAYLPAGRKAFYYEHYRQDVLSRAGLAPGVYAPGVHKDVPLADMSTFLKAWRMEVPWLIVSKSVSMFTRCSVCEYLKLLKEQTPKDQEKLRAAIEARLGRHFEFQAAQRLAHARVEEDCAQSGGQKWLMIIDKMDQKKTVVPTVWSQLPTPLFKDPDRRIIAGVIGSMWYGTANTTHHLRTVFPDCSHGADMQSSAILWNLHATALEEQHLPTTLVIAADNTRKETKNQTTMWFLIWLLCALNGTALCQIEVIFLLVGHTHNQLDRFFSRLGAAIAGQDYFTVPGMLEMVRANVKHCKTKSGHLAQVWGWKALLEHEATKRMHNLDPVHAFRYIRSPAGIHMQWKQWCTDETWSKPLLVVDADGMGSLGQFRPAKLKMEFPHQGQPILDWVDRFELWCAAQPGSKYQHLEAEMAWLRQAATHQVPGVYAPGADVEAMVQVLRQLPGMRPKETSSHKTFHQDILTQLFPSSDIPSMPLDTLVRIDNLTHQTNGQAMRSKLICPGSTLVVRVPVDTKVRGTLMLFLCAVALETSRKQELADHIAVGWYLPPDTKEQCFRTPATMYHVRLPSHESETLATVREYVMTQGSN